MAWQSIESDERTEVKRTGLYDPSGRCNGYLYRVTDHKFDDGVQCAKDTNFFTLVNGQVTRISK